MSDSLTQLKELLAKRCNIQKMQPALFASDAEVNIVVITLLCEDGSTHVITAYREEALALREYVRTKT
jgi:hypothetical protein